MPHRLPHPNGTPPFGPSGHIFCSFLQCEPTHALTLLHALVTLPSLPDADPSLPQPRTRGHLQAKEGAGGVALVLAVSEPHGGLLVPGSAPSLPPSGRGGRKSRLRASAPALQPMGQPSRPTLRCLCAEPDRGPGRSASCTPAPPRSFPHQKPPNMVSVQRLQLLSCGNLGQSVT